MHVRLLISGPSLTCNLLSISYLQCNVSFPVSPAFRKLFPEYVEKYTEQQLAEQRVSEQLSPESPNEENSRPKVEKVGSGEDMKTIDTPKEARKNRKQSFPTWMLLLLVSIFGIVMALPLLQL